METIKSGGLRRAFVLYVLITFLLVSALSGTVIWVCLSLQDHLLPDSDLVYLTVQRSDDQGNETTTTVPMPLNDVLKEIPSMISMEDTDGDILSDEQNVRYSVTKIENSFSALSPKRQLVYQISQIAMVALPVLFSLTGILICGFLFYRRKLKTPVELLSTAAERIALQDLDFQISYPSEDEMGALCASFEEMRQTLKDNSQKLWDMVEERRRLQSSVAHDLRNPIAIIQGYAQYLQLNLSGGRIHKEKISEVVANIYQTSLRLERYTDSLRTVSRLEELEMHPQPVDFASLSSDMKEDLRLLTAEKGLELEWENNVPDRELTLDTRILYRILENLIGNAVRFASRKITVQFSCCHKTTVSASPARRYLEVTVSDDGPGFSQKVLNSSDSYTCAGSNEGNHLGIGLSICRILCRKQGGQLFLSNSDQGGAVVKFIVLS